MAYTIQDALLAECLLTSSWSADWKFPWNTVFGLLHKLERFAIVSHLLLPERCCLQIQSVYCVNYAKNILSGNELLLHILSSSPFVRYFPDAGFPLSWALISILFIFRCWKIYGQCYIFAKFIHIPVYITVCYGSFRTWKSHTLHSSPIALHPTHF